MPRGQGEPEERGSEKGQGERRMTSEIVDREQAAVGREKGQQEKVRPPGPERRQR